jgi:AcrR family transcriptional regulator
VPKTGLSAQEIRDKAIESTVARMRRHGFEKVRLVDVAKDLDLSHAALYSHFADKAALLDAVSERWLRSIDAELERVIHRDRDPLLKIHEWFLRFYQMKRAKVLRDPELYRAFDHASEKVKPFVIEHLQNVNRQMVELVKEAIAAKKLRKDSPERIVSILLAAMVGFTHPKLVAQHLEEKREPLLKQTLGVVLRGLR